MSYANEESYKILNGTAELLTSPGFSDNNQTTNEYCIDGTTNNQYTLRLIDSFGDSWSSGAWVSVAGIYGNVVLKAVMTGGATEDFALSLYYPVMKNEEWKMTSTSSSVAPDWNSVAFTGSDWADVVLGTNTAAVMGTQYFRKDFDGISGMAAYELELHYQYGIVAYVNGVEVYRDHMPDGAVTAATPSNGAFEAYEYHGVIIPASEIEGDNNVLAVELHFPDVTSENAVAFDAYVASLAPSTHDAESCLIYPYAVDITATSGDNAGSIFDWNKSNPYSTNQFPATVTYDLKGPRMHVNALRVWTDYSPDTSPGSFTLQGAMTPSGTYASAITIMKATHAPNTYKTFYSYLSAKPYQSYRLVIDRAMGSSRLEAYEVQPMTCHSIPPPEVTFSPASYSVYAGGEPVLIRPEIAEFTSCSIAPSLPDGLTLDEVTCTVSGTPSATLETTLFTMTSVMQGQGFQGNFTLEVMSCSAQLVKFVRTYTGSASKEWFVVKDAETQDVLLEVAENAGQNDYEDWTGALCLTSTSKLEITMGSSNSRWADKSFLYVYNCIDGTEYETVARMRYDKYFTFNATRVVNTDYAAASREQWFYKMGEVPANWYDENMSGWASGELGSFPASTNPIQLYKQTFFVDSLEGVPGFVISLRYLYGCVIYVNGVEAFRNGVSGDLTASSVSSNAYDALMYRQISLSVNHLQEGNNTIAIAIVAQTASQTDSVFDCAVRLLGDQEGSRVFDYTVTSSGLKYNPDDIAEHSGGFFVRSDSCTPNTWTLTFNDDRREWLSSVLIHPNSTQTNDYPAEFVLKARNAESEAWTTLKTVTGMIWRSGEQFKKLWLETTTPYNQYQFENFASGNPNNCKWEFGTLDLEVDVVPAAMASLAYTSAFTYKDAELDTVYPVSDIHYYDFTITPALPAGVVIDANSGIVAGSPSEAFDDTHIITAKKFGGGVVSALFNLTVEACTGGRTLITLTARMDSHPGEGSYKLFAGKDTDGEVVASASAFTVRNGLNHAYWCLPHNIYTLVLYDSYKDGWDNPAGWYLTVDKGAMIFEMGQMPYGVPSVSTVFSSLLPFQIEYDDWKLWNSAEAVAADWTSVSFDDSAWETKKAAELGEHATTTAYIRHEVSIPSIDDYHVLNVRMKYAGGVVVYFNGVKVARFNLVDDYDASSEAIAAHDASLFSKFHIILSTVNAVEGKNVIAFEIHRAASQSAIVFDATGVFGVNECSIVVDTFSTIDSSDVSGCTKEDLLDLLPTTYGNIPNAAGSFLSWIVENLEGSKFNSFALQTNTAVSGYGFSVYGRWEEGEDFISALAVTDQSTKNRERSAWAMPVGIAGFTQFRFVVDMAANIVPSTNAYVMQYCAPRGNGTCAADGEYPAVSNGEKSVVKGNSEYMYGYAYRVCTDGVLGEEQYEGTFYAPANLTYSATSFDLALGEAFSIDEPTYTNFILSFEVMEGALPAGLSLNATTGEIAGIPSDYDCLDGCSVTIAGSNPSASVNVTLSFVLVPSSFSYDVAGAGVHVEVRDEVLISPTITTRGTSSFTRFEATGLPAGLSIESDGYIKGTLTDTTRTANVTVTGYLSDTVFQTVSFTLFLHDHNSNTPAVSSDSSCSLVLRLYATSDFDSETVYLASASSTASLALAVPAMKRDEIKSVFVCLEEGEYVVFGYSLQIVVLKGANPIAFLDELDDLNPSFATTPVCEESPDVECDIVISNEAVTLKESGAESGTTYAHGEIVALDRSKIYEM